MSVPKKWHVGRSANQEPDRESITDEYGFDLVARLDDIRRAVESR